MMHKILNAHNDWTGFILRITLGLIIFPHGAQKLFGWFGGYGFEGTMNFFTEVVHLPWIIGFLVILIETVGALLLLIGIGSRVMAGLMIVLMIGILWTSHLENGFFMNWFGNQKGEGFEFDLVIIGLALGLFFNGGGKFSLDRKLAH